MLAGSMMKRKRHGDGDTAGLGDDKMREAEERLAAKTLERFKEDAEELLSLMSKENAVRVFSLLEDASQLNRDWVSKLQGSPGAPAHGRALVGDYGEPYGMNNETFGAQALHQLTAIFGGLGKDQQITSLVRALKTAKDGGLKDVEEKIQKKLDDLLTADSTNNATSSELKLLEEAEEESSDEPAVVDGLPEGEEVVLG